MNIDPAKQSYFIKLGEKGEWDRDCIRDGEPAGYLRLGYDSTPVHLCLAGRWEEVAAHWQARSPNGNAGSATRHAQQIAWFFEAQPNQVFITFFDRRLWWCQPRGAVEVLVDGTHVRQTVNGWRDFSMKQETLRMDRLSGSLLATGGFRGTICKVRAHAYLMRKILGELSPELEEADRAIDVLKVAVLKLIRLLTWQDFETLVELIYSTSGWRRVTRTGGTQKTTDLDLVSPTTGDLALVQVKSKADNASLRNYVNEFGDSGAYQRMFFVWHTGEIDKSIATDGVVLIGPERLSEMVIDAGLSSWVRDKV